MVGQHSAVDDRLTGRENLILLGHLTGSRRVAARRRATELLDQFGLTSAADRAVRTYSGGMRRRIDLAAALVHHPAVLLLDEPSAGLDPSARAQLWQLVRQLVASGTTVLLTSQYLEEVDQLADRVLVLDGGRVRAEGTPDELKGMFGSAVIQLQLTAPGLLGSYVQALNPLGELSWPTSEDRLEVRVSGTTSPLIAVVRALDDAGLQPAEVWSRPPTLDDVFLALTEPAGSAAVISQ